MTATLAAYRNAILADMGYREGANNYTKFGEWYAGQVNNGAFRNAAWCDMSTCYWADKVGARDIVGLFAWTPSHAQWFANQGRWSNLPIAGGIAFWDWSGSNSISAIDHVSALIESVDGNGQAVTLDGNYSDRVDRWRHPMRNFVGCGLPPWSSSAGSVPPPVLQNWDGVSYPGRFAFDLGSMHPAVTKLGQMLVAKGFGGAYKEGPGVPMGPADVQNCAAFQRSQGWTGADADGYPGPETWKRLSGASTGSTPPPPPPPAPASKAPPTQGYQGNVYLGKLRRGQQDSDSVKVFQRACRNYPDVSTIPLNPSGVTGNYGPETEAMCRKLYQTFNQWQPGAGWGDGDLGVPGPSLLNVLGCRIVG
jgi:hypothetical protein